MNEINMARLVEESPHPSTGSPDHISPSAWGELQTTGSLEVIKAADVEKDSANKGETR